MPDNEAFRCPAFPVFGVIILVFNHFVELEGLTPSIMWTWSEWDMACN
jgi:hypothetical protein